MKEYPEKKQVDEMDWKRNSHHYTMRERYISLWAGSKTVWL